MSQHFKDYGLDSSAFDIVFTINLLATQLMYNGMQSPIEMTFSKESFLKLMSLMSAYDPNDSRVRPSAFIFNSVAGPIKIKEQS